MNKTEVIYKIMFSPDDVPPQPDPPTEPKPKSKW
jgi:hypothetical protein